MMANNWDYILSEVEIANEFELLEDGIITSSAATIMASHKAMRAEHDRLLGMLSRAERFLAMCKTGSWSKREKLEHAALLMDIKVILPAAVDTKEGT